MMDRRDLQLNALLGITQAINNNLPQEDLLKIYRFTLLGDLKVTKMALFVRKDDEWHHAVDFGTDKKWNHLKLNDRFANLKDTEIIRDDKDFSPFHIAIPILHKDALLAILFLEEVEDVTFVRALTNIIIVAIENKRLARARLEQEAYQRELELAKKVQNFLFPKVLPNSPELKIEAVYLPHHNVGGDYYDYIKISETKFLLCVADVSGKGVPAALLMSNFQATLRVLMRRTDDVKEIVNELNSSTCLTGNGEHFITFFICIYDFEAKVLEYINCGHNAQYLIRNKELVELDKGTTVLGMFDPLPFLESACIDQLEEFVFFGFTDGLTEVFNEAGEPFGEERVEDMIKKVDDLNFLHNNLLQEMDAFRGSMAFHDDITLLSCKVKNR